MKILLCILLNIIHLHESIQNHILKSHLRQPFFNEILWYNPITLELTLIHFIVGIIQGFTKQPDLHWNTWNSSAYLVCDCIYGINDIAHDTVGLSCLLRTHALLTFAMAHSCWLRLSVIVLVFFLSTLWLLLLNLGTSGGRRNGRCWFSILLWTILIVFHLFNCFWFCNYITWCCCNILPNILCYVNACLAWVLKPCTYLVNHVCKRWESTGIFSFQGCFIIEF